MIAGVFEVPASVLAWFYSFTNNYAAAIALIAVLVMMLVTPLNLKSTKGMLEMQRLAPEMRKLQTEHRGDRQKLNEEMMKLYQEHKVNPMASCLPLVAQMPVFIIMFRILHRHDVQAGRAEPSSSPRRCFAPATTRHPIGRLRPPLPRRRLRAVPVAGPQDRDELVRARPLAVARRGARRDFGRGLIYALLVVVLGGLYFVQQRMVAARAAVSPTMSPGQQKLMQYLPVVFAVFQVFFLLGLVVYYIVQTVLRIAQQYYITKRFYGHDESLGRQAQRAGEQRPRARQAGRRWRWDAGAGPPRPRRRQVGQRKRPAGKQSAQAVEQAVGRQGQGRRRRTGASGWHQAHDRAQEPSDADQPNASSLAAGRQSSQEPQEALSSVRTEQTWNGWRQRARRSPRPRRWRSTGSASLTTTPSSRSSRSHATVCSA